MDNYNESRKAEREKGKKFAYDLQEVTDKGNLWLKFSGVARIRDWRGSYKEDSFWDSETCFLWKASFRFSVKQLKAQ